MRLFLVILAAGDGKRLNSKTPKPFSRINNKTLLEYSLDAFKDFSEIRKVIIVYNKKHKRFLEKLSIKNTIKIVGGKIRQESTFNALKKIRKMNCSKVLIHDSARPNPSKKMIRTIINYLKNNDAVIPIIKATDATKRIKKNMIFKNIKRNTLRFSQTPQGFSYKKIYSKLKKNIDIPFDDEASLFTKDNEKICTVPGSKNNFKVTSKEDLNLFRSLKKGKIYVGIGFDVHKLKPKRKMYLAGVRIKSKLGTLGHSDGDPVLHATIDAILGACRMGDIGKLFSNKNKKYKNIRSTILLKKVIKIINDKNYLINNIDINIITQKPKIKKYSKKMIETVSKICKINSNQINIKGKTTEKLGVIGKERAIASEVIASVLKYD